MITRPSNSLEVKEPAVRLPVALAWGPQRGTAAVEIFGSKGAGRMFARSVGAHAGQKGGSIDDL